MRLETSERAVLENLVPELEAEGFDVYTHPSGAIIPPFMRGYSPDAIALRSDRNLAIEVVQEGATARQRLEELRKLLANQKGWELRVYWVTPSTLPKSVDEASRPTIEQSIKEVEELSTSGRSGPALLMAWATFEAVARALLPEKFRRPQTPARLIEVLATDGELTPGEADVLRRLADSRNGLIHGGLNVSVSNADMQRFIDVLKTLLGLLPRL
jgi:uncharacterized protein YutE (UPF0331/DUF86 family)